MWLLYGTSHQFLSSLISHHSEKMGEKGGNMGLAPGRVCLGSLDSFMLSTIGCLSGWSTATLFLTSHISGCLQISLQAHLKHTYHGDLCEHDLCMAFPKGNAYRCEESNKEFSKNVGSGAVELQADPVRCFGVEFTAQWFVSLWGLGVGSSSLTPSPPEWGGFNQGQASWEVWNI